jgi:hypothetical protein
MDQTRPDDERAQSTNERDALTMAGDLLAPRPDDERTHDLLRAIGLVLIAAHAQRVRVGVAVRGWLDDIRRGES